MQLANEHLTRQMDIIPTDVLGTPITVIGAGAIGSWTVMALAKMGFCDITVYDFDKVEPVNLNAQVYGFHDVGRLKVHALHGAVKLATNIDIEVKAEPYEMQENRSARGIVIAAVDSMRARALIWNSLKAKAINCLAYIDPRMGAEEAMLYCMRPMHGADQKTYEKTLYSDRDAVQERCTAKATAYTALMLSGLVSKTVKDLLTGDNSYIRTCQWSIKGDQFLAWNASGKQPA